MVRLNEKGCKILVFKRTGLGNPRASVLEAQQ